MKIIDEHWKTYNSKIESETMKAMETKPENRGIQTDVNLK